MSRPSASSSTSSPPATGRRILFMRTKHHAKKLAKQLTDAGIPAVDLHGNLSQVAARPQPRVVLRRHSRVLVATDVAARGVHVDDIELVIHVDPPAEHKAYLHRSGRTARAGERRATSSRSCCPTQRKDTAALLRKAQSRSRRSSVTAVIGCRNRPVGDVAEYVKPAPRRRSPLAGSGGGRSQGANAQRKRAQRDGSGAAQNDRPRRDRSGRPARMSDAPRHGAPAGQGRTHERTNTRAEAPTGTPRTKGSRRAGAQAGSGRIMVGTVVRANTRGR